MIKITSKQAGDTIIEVLLAMSVIGMVLGVAFGIANRSVRIGQEAQERTEALKIAESQLEIFKNEYPLNQGIQSRYEDRPFCLDNKDSIVKVIESSDALCRGINGSGLPGLYNVSIIPPSSNTTTDPSRAYEIKVSWQRLGGASNSIDNTLSLYFKPGSI